MMNSKKGTAWVWIIIILILIAIGVGLFLMMGGYAASPATSGGSLPQPPALPA